jgi:hypothetical protein
MNKFDFLRAFRSPFQRPKIRFYIGRRNIGTPYFLPRKWVKATPELAHKAAIQHIEKEESYNRLNPQSARKIKPYNEIYEEKLRYNYAVRKRIGFDFVGLGWKTKWTSTDFRFECAPRWSFVAGPLQIAIVFDHPHPNMYWEAWLFYRHCTDRSARVSERVAKMKSEFPLTFKIDTKEETKIVNYYDKILRSKWIK